jgi:hypothetical protein
MPNLKRQAPGFSPELDRACEEAFSNEGAPPPQGPDRDALLSAVAVAPAIVPLRERKRTVAFAAWLATQRPRGG